jgi:Domain of unknown function (DUF4392)
LIYCNDVKTGSLKLFVFCSVGLFHSAASKDPKSFAFASTAIITITTKRNIGTRTDLHPLLRQHSSFRIMSSKMDGTRSNNIYDHLQAIIGTDAGGRGMKSLIVEGDLQQAAECLASVSGHVVILSGFPCCIQHKPPTETDGPPGTMAIARAAAVLGNRVTVATEVCNETVFAAALKDLAMPSVELHNKIDMACFHSTFSQSEEESFQELCKSCDLLISCERAGEAQDGNCYTMRGINMNEQEGLIGPINRIVAEKPPGVPLISIGDGGNELGMGKVYSEIVKNIPNGDKIGCAVPADYLVAASVSNWGGYALAVAAAVARARQEHGSVSHWINLCVPTVEEEEDLLHRCVRAGCRDGVSGKMEATVDGMPLETSMECLQDLRIAAINS